MAKANKYQKIQMVVVYKTCQKEAKCSTKIAERDKRLIRKTVTPSIKIENETLNYQGTQQIST